MRILTIILILIMLSLPLFAEDINTGDEMYIQFNRYNPEEATIAFEEKGDFVFWIGNLEFIRLCSNGDFYIKGEKCTRDYDLYLKFKQWIYYVYDEIIKQEAK